MKKLILSFALVAVLASACGDDTSKPAATGGAIPTAPSGSGSTTAASPQRIVSLSSTATETAVVPCNEVGSRTERSRPVSKQHRDPTGALVRRGQVGFSVSIEVACRDGYRIGSGSEVGFRTE